MSDSILAEAVSAGVSGFVSAGTLYPLEVVKTVAQASSSSSSSDGDGDDDETDGGGWAVASRLYYRDGPKGSMCAFYEGVWTSAIQASIEKGLYFLCYSAFKAAYLGDSRTGRPAHLGTGANLALGCLAEWSHLPVTLPVDCLTTRIQTGGDTDAGPFAIMAAMLSEGGVAGLYRGYQAYVVLCLKPAIQYTVYEQVKRIVLAARRRAGKASKTLGSAEAFALGLVARTISTLAVFPYTRCKVLLQSEKKAGADGGAPQSIPAMICAMYGRGGVADVYRGIGPELTRGVLSTALMLMVKERITETIGATLGGGR
mmetsp:Transcript_1982/g.4289  ORF Transcript_1982/g.4289 Transcript_1982/m.4289 type:complete len:314 (+) Transcript_1982:77-1018(+)